MKTHIFYNVIDFHFYTFIQLLYEFANKINDVFYVDFM